jgi:hypothetical protein
VHESVHAPWVHHARTRGQGVVAWDVGITNPLGKVVASDDLWTLVAKKKMKMRLCSH